ncbi:uncharacterized protein LOC122402248 isoform X2 [Colletes gigas]|uniref:uncharacterized protein LOC122402248 isoform X2 n=1 Tax=Colletes gigas TaxID=935657 RepID=UPI001C9B384A|nr:uncharacterized protein LOC122402248 isoform X2 [Colletes gigas]
MVLTVTEDTPADMLAGSMELLVQLPREHHHQTQRVTVQRSTPMMDLLVQIVTAHKLSASSYTLQAIGERGMVLPHQPNTPIGALDALQVKLLPKQGTFIPQKTKQANQPFETTFRLQVHLPRNQLYVSRVSPKMNLGEILDEVCREKNLDRNKYELRHPANLEETLDLSLSLQDYHLQEVTLYAKQGRTLGAALSTQDIMALQRQEERRRQQAKQGVFGFVFKKSKEGSLSTDSLGGRSASPARSDETGRSTSPLYPPTRPQRKRRPAPKPPVQTQPEVSNSSEENAGDSGKEKVVISHSRNSSDSSGYHEASVLSDNPDSAGRLPETLPRRNRVPPESPRKLAHTSQSSKSLGNLATVSGTLSRGISSTSLSSTGLRKKRAAPPPPITRPLSSAMSTQALERIVDSEESLTSDMDPSKPPSDIGVPSKANSDIGMTTVAPNLLPTASNIDQKVPKSDLDPYRRSGSINIKLPTVGTGDPVEDTLVDARAPRKRVGQPMPVAKCRKALARPVAPRRHLAASSSVPDTSSKLDSSPSSPRRPDAGILDEKGAKTKRSDCFEDTVVDSDANKMAAEARRVQKNSNSKIDAVVISTIPKCEHLQSLTNEQPPLQLGEGKMARDTKMEGGENDHKRVRIPRTASKSNDFETNTLERQKRHLTSSEDITFALNINVASNFGDQREGVGGGDRNRGSDANLLETDMLLQKVSATLSHALPHPVSNTVPVDGVCPEETNLEASTISKEKDSFDSKSPTNEDSKQNDYVVMTSTPNLTVNSQDTSDYVSAGDEDLVEWEYQLPAPPTAFRDASPVFDSSQTLVSSTQSYGNPTTEAEKPETSAKRRGPRSTLTEEELLKEESKEKVEEHERLETLQRVKSEDKPDTSDTLERDPRNSFETVEGLLEEKSEEKMKNPEKLEDNSRLEAPQAFKNPRTEKKPNISVKRDLRNSLVASEEGLLEEKFREKLKKRERLDGDSRLEVSQTFRNPNTREDLLENESREKIEQNERLDRQLRLEASQCLRSPNISDEKDPKTPPKTPENLLQEELKKEMEKRERLGDNSRKEPNFDSSTPRVAPTDNTLSNFTITTYTGQQDRFLESKMEDSSDYQEKKSQEPKPKTKELLNRSSNVQRSKSHVPVWDKSKFQGNGADFRGLVDMNNPGTRSNGLNVTRNNEKFSQWRDNSLKRQGEPTKEKQLQSLQVLKTILPQLKNAQQAEENVPKESDDTVLSEKTRSKMAATDSNGDLFRGPIDEKSDSKRSSEPISKHYTYAGPPAIILGSWSERQPANVQIKMDTDYKLGSNEIAPTITSSRTELNHEDSRNRRGNTEKNNGFHGKSGSKDLAKKLIAHTTPLGFKKPHNDDDRPMVTAVELKKSFADDKQDDNVIDTSPMNFKQLSRVFGQEVCLRSKPKRLEANSRKENEPSKGFNAFTESRNGDQRSGLPTMPVITGVTLKSARSKSAVVQDSRDALLESIRNFGGRENLKNAMERC